MRELPRKLTVAQLADLFEGRTRLVERLAQLDNPLQAARDLVARLPEAEQLEALHAPPAIGAGELSDRSAREQGPDEEAAVETELAYLNQVYEEKFGFRFVVFVNRRPKAEIVPVLRERLQRTREQELETGLRELVAIAEDRWRRG